MLLDKKIDPKNTNKTNWNWRDITSMDPKEFEINKNMKGRSKLYKHKFEDKLNMTF